VFENSWEQSLNFCFLPWMHYSCLCQVNCFLFSVVMHAIFCIECFSSSIFGAIFIPSLSQVKEVTPAARRRDARLSFAFVYPDKNGRFVVREVSSLCALCMWGDFFFFFFDSYMLNAQAISYRLPHLSKAYGDISTHGLCKSIISMFFGYNHVCHLFSVGITKSKNKSCYFPCFISVLSSQKIMCRSHITFICYMTPFLQSQFMSLYFIFAFKHLLDGWI